MPHAPAPVPQDEAERLAVLASFGVLDTPGEERFDEIARLAAEVCGMPIALVSLVDEERQWFKARHGVELESTPRDWAFCAHALLSPGEVLVVDDALADPRFATSPLVLDLGLRSYAGTPLVGRDGQAVGTLCVLDTEPRRLGDRQLAALRLLGRQVVAQLELDRATRRLVASQQALASSERALRDVGRTPLCGEDELERALDRGELVVHYQPFWAVTAHGSALRARVSGAEALVRWRHPERGLLLPEHVVPGLERRGLSSRLGEVVLAEALRDLAAWVADDLVDDAFRVHVNIAAPHLHEGTIGTSVDRLLASTGAPAAQLCLEVTESALLDAEAFRPDDAHALVERGLTLALDDFGTGHSSLTQLRSYPFSCVKVDRSFVAGLGVDAQDEVIVDTVVSLALRLGMVPVCEGVETPAQLDRVLEAGCAEVQGWLFGRASDERHWRDEVLHEGEQVLLHASRSPAAPRAAAAALPTVVAL